MELFQVVHTPFSPKLKNAFHAARGIVLMSIAVAGIACIAAAFYLVDGRAARQIWNVVGSRRALAA